MVDNNIAASVAFELINGPSLGSDGDADERLGDENHDLGFLEFAEDRQEGVCFVLDLF